MSRTWANIASHYQIQPSNKRADPQVLNCVWVGVHRTLTNTTRTINSSVQKRVWFQILVAQAGPYSRGLKDSVWQAKGPCVHGLDICHHMRLRHLACTTPIRRRWAEDRGTPQRRNQIIRHNRSPPICAQYSSSSGACPGSLKEVEK